MRVVAVNVGAIGSLPYRGRRTATAIAKTPAVGRVHVADLGLEGDEQADRRHHGGPDKAVCSYPSEHLPGWSERLRRDLQPGAFGENLSTAGVVEEDAGIGDVWRVGTAVLEITQPRTPCHKLAARHRHPHLPRYVRETGRTGWYLRVLEPGTIGAGDAIEHLGSAPHRVTLAEVNAFLRDEAGSDGVPERLLAWPGLPTPWRAALEHRVAAVAGGRVESAPSGRATPAALPDRRSRRMKPEDARTLLERERRRIEEDLRNVAADPDNSKPDLGLDAGDQGSELFVEERDEGRREELERELAAVERAEARLAEGRYGLSVQSGVPIPDARLEAIPWAELTVEEEEQAERR